MVKQIETSDIRKVMEGYGESLPDLGAKYGYDFVKWFRQREPTIYKDWMARMKQEGNKGMFCRGYTGKDFLFDFSNNTLDGLVHDKHDHYLAEFYNQNAEANKHIEHLLENL